MKYQVTVEKTKTGYSAFVLNFHDVCATVGISHHEIIENIAEAINLYNGNDECNEEDIELVT